MTIAFLGAGLMGAGFVRRLCANGEAVNVWSRSATKAQALRAHGAKPCDTATEAVQGVERIHVSLADDESVDAVLEPLAAMVPSTTWIIDHTTTAATPTAQRCARWAERGKRFVHAPVFMAPANAQEGSGVMLISGQPAHHQALLPALQRMTGKVVYLGASPERAAAFKLFGNLTLLGLAGVLGDVARLAHSIGIAPSDAMTLFEHFNPGSMLPARAAKIAAGPFSPPTFEIRMARKDVRLMIEEAQRHDVNLAVMPAVAALYDAAIARGDGERDALFAMAFPRPTIVDHPAERT